MWPKRRRPTCEQPVDDSTAEDSADLNDQLNRAVIRLQTHSEAMAVELDRLRRLTETPRQRRPHGNDRNP